MNHYFDLNARTLILKKANFRHTSWSHTAMKENPRKRPRMPPNSATRKQKDIVIEVFAISFLELDQLMLFLLNSVFTHQGGKWVD